MFVYNLALKERKELEISDLIASYSFEKFLWAFYTCGTEAGGPEAEDGAGPAQEPQHARQDCHPLLQLVRQRLRLLRPDPEHGPGEL